MSEPRLELMLGQMVIDANAKAAKAQVALRWLVNAYRVQRCPSGKATWTVCAESAPELDKLIEHSRHQDTWTYALDVLESLEARQ